MAITPQIPPHSLDAEHSVLGALLIDPNALMKISDFLRIDDFYSQGNQDIYEIILNLSNLRKPIDLITVPEELKKKNLLEPIGGVSFLAELMTIVPSAVNILEYAHIVKQKSTLRKMVVAGQKITSFGYEEDENIESLLEQSEKEVFTISQTFLKNKFIPINEILSGRFEIFSERHDNDDEDLDIGVKSGFGNLDKILGGFQPSDLVILAARPSMGKTGFALAAAINSADFYGKSIGIFSLEMSKEQLVDRMFANILQVDSYKLQKGQLSDDEFMRMGPAMDKLSKMSIYIDDTVESSISALRAKARRLQMEHGLDMIIIDYLQLMSTGNPQLAGNRVLEIAEISRSLKALARELHIPVMALSQLSRGVESRPDKRPMLSDLRDSGAIEQDADVVIMIYRDEYYNKDTDKPGITELLIRKHRNGEVGECELKFDKAKMRFLELDPQNDY
ncbi:TPA: replicative DNA helicase [Candidatus Gracilibacteria bacterium]|nr:replicative DNA helicase [Candidatus Peregrinibacteria bacterium]HIQ56478.1 replicative DNA helicase [Candidatus Gracilibacteria bacterium]HIQ57407.1 replicative DNA helicase [Candidatus Gracilibacteria bacterium]